MSHVICVSLATPQNRQHKHEIFFSSYFSDRTGCHRIMTHYVAIFKNCLLCSGAPKSLYAQYIIPSILIWWKVEASRLSWGIANGKVHGPRLMKLKITYGSCSCNLHKVCVSVFLYQLLFRIVNITTLINFTFINN